MPTSLFLIAHKVRGEPAFDIAMQMQCPKCDPAHSELVHGCLECNDLGFWWIIPTSGHRAYPASVIAFEELVHMDQLVAHMPLPVMDSLPDHYQTRAEPAKPKLDLSALLPKPAPIQRRY